MNILPNEEIRIANGSRVELHFEASLPNGTIIDFWRKSGRFNE